MAMILLLLLLVNWSCVSGQGINDVVKASIKAVIQDLSKIDWDKVEDTVITNGADQAAKDSMKTDLNSQITDLVDARKALDIPPGFLNILLKKDSFRVESVAKVFPQLEALFDKADALMKACEAANMNCKQPYETLVNTAANHRANLDAAKNAVESRREEGKVLKDGIDQMIKSGSLMDQLEKLKNKLPFNTIEIPAIPADFQLPSDLLKILTATKLEEQTVDPADLNKTSDILRAVRSVLEECSKAVPDCKDATKYPFPYARPATMFVVAFDNAVSKYTANYNAARKTTTAEPTKETDQTEPTSPAVITEATSTKPDQSSTKPSSAAKPAIDAQISCCPVLCMSAPMPPACQNFNTNQCACGRSNSCSSSCSSNRGCRSQNKCCNCKGKGSCCDEKKDKKSETTVVVGPEVLVVDDSKPKSSSSSSSPMILLVSAISLLASLLR